MAAAVLLVLTAGACTGNVPSDRVGATPSASTESPSTSDTASPSPSTTPSSTDSATPSSSAPAPSPVGTPSVTPSETPAASPAPSTAPSPTQTGPPPVLDRAAAGRDLTLADFFSAPVEWRGGQFDVASDRGLTGISGPIRRCAEDEASAQTFELRLANSFSKISMRFGQANDSETSDAEVLVRLVGNGAFIDSRRVKFNKLDSVTIPVNNVNAFKIQVFMTGKKCDEDKVVNAVLTGLRLE